MVKNIMVYTNSGIYSIFKIYIFLFKSLIFVNALVLYITYQKDKFQNCGYYQNHFCCKKKYIYV